MYLLLDIIDNPKPPKQFLINCKQIMKSKNILILVSVAVVIIIIFYAVQGSQNNPVYRKEVEKEREEKDHFMRTSSTSPLAKAQDTFKGLNYFPVDEKYRITADLTPVESRKAVLLPTSDGKEQRYMEYSYATFDLDGVHNKLLILEVMEMGPYRGKLFLAFGDETSAHETYGAGRYLDVNKVPGSSTIILDFNRAYNPYCAYDDTYSCPFPPPENLLKVAIKAGEKSYHD
jgi:uncharacterized protein (DUF1684 family)